MKFGNFITFLFLIYETFSNLVVGKKVKEEKNDCEKLVFYLQNYTIPNLEYCCKMMEKGIECDKDGYITLLSL